MPAFAENLNARFNRAKISERDFQEAVDYLQAMHRRRLPTVKRALLLAAVIAYSRPFLQSEKIRNRNATGQLAININTALEAEELRLHQKLLDFRNQAIAHSE